ncbi:hypothetical protein FKM82_003773 [Ascaphus truei]
MANLSRSKGAEGYNQVFAHSHPKCVGCEKVVLCNGRCYVASRSSLPGTRDKRDQFVAGGSGCKDSPSCQSNCRHALGIYRASPGTSCIPGIAHCCHCAISLPCTSTFNIKEVSY